MNFQLSTGPDGHIILSWVEASQFSHGYSQTSFDLTAHIEGIVRRVVQSELHPSVQS